MYLYRRLLTWSNCALSVIKHGNYYSAGGLSINYKFKKLQISYLCDLEYGKNNHVLWDKSIGKILRFDIENTPYELCVKDHDDKNILVEFNGTETWIKKNLFIKATLSDFVHGITRTGEFRYNIGDVITSETGNSIKILDRKRSPHKMYYTECQGCGSREWKAESLISTDKKYMCVICAGRKYKKGFNDITVTDPWMIPYFPGGFEEAQKYTASCGKRVILQCPYCGRKTDEPKLISKLYSNHGISCKCKGSRSYPERVIGEILDYNNIDYIYDYHPEFAKGKKYDFYLKNYDIILEADGELGHGNYQPWKTKEKANEEIEIDKWKDEVAHQNGLTVYRIEYRCDEKNKFIENFKNVVPKFIWDNTDWSEVVRKAEENVNYNICKQYEESDKSINAIKHLAEVFHYCEATIRKALHMGNEYGWCTYIPKTGIYAKKYKKRF